MHHRLNRGDLVLERSQVSVDAVVAVASSDESIGPPFHLSVRPISNAGSLAALADLASPASFELD